MLEPLQIFLESYGFINNIKQVRKHIIFGIAVFVFNNVTCDMDILLIN